MKIVAALRRLGVLTAVMLLVLAAGATAMVVSDRSTAAQGRVLRQDRLTLATSLATLARGYFGQLAEAQAAEGQALGPAVSAPPAVAAASLDHAAAALTGKPAAVLVSVAGEPVAATGNAAPLGAALTQVQASLTRQLLAGQPGLSPVAFVNGRPTVVVAVPVPGHGGTAGVLFAGYDLTVLPVASYVQQLDVGSHASTSVVDPAGRMVTAASPADVGRLEPSAVLTAASRLGPAGGVAETSGPSPVVVAAYPVGLGGWMLLVDQPAPDFYGSLLHANAVLHWVLLGLLVVVSAALLVLHNRRQSAVHAMAGVALVDTLTGLPNRVAFTRALEASMERHRRDGMNVALLFCDLDGFKSVNDRLGHAAGDRLLVAAASRLRTVVEASGNGRAVMARLGGDEFTVLLEGADVKPDAQRVAEALTGALSVPFVLGAEEVAIGVSVGVAYAQPGRDLLRDADLAMYRTKAVRRAKRPATTPDEAPEPSAPQVPSAPPASPAVGARVL